MSDRITALLRTTVPALWAALLTWAIARGLPTGAAEQLGDLGTTLLLPAAVAGYYAAARWLESQPWMPRWLITALLGSAKPPSYPLPVVAGPYVLPGDGSPRPVIGEPGPYVHLGDGEPGPQLPRTRDGLIRGAAERLDRTD